MKTKFHLIQLAAFSIAVSASMSSVHASDRITAAEPTNRELLQAFNQENQPRLDAIKKRGRLSNYEQLMRSGSNFRVLPDSSSDSAKVKQEKQIRNDIAKQRAAIDLASLGFTQADVTAYRKKNLDLFSMAGRSFAAAGTVEDKLALADTVVVATAVKNSETQPRFDGFRSALLFKVTRSLKGATLAGDAVYIPQLSGPNPDGTVTQVSVDPETVPGKSYLLVLSRNWYEQYVAEQKKEPQSKFNALSFLIYEISEGNSLLSDPLPSKNGENPKSLRTVEEKLKQLPGPNAKGGV